MQNLNGQHILLGISGGIAAYKSAYLCRLLKEAGADVQVAMSTNGARFITPLTMETLSQKPVLQDMFPANRYVGTQHIDIAGWTDLAVIAPATANLIGKLAVGLADDMLSTLLIATSAPILLAPAMNTDMYLNAAVQENLKTLQRRGILFVDPGVGRLACNTVGVGRMAEPAEIAARADEILGARKKKDLLGRKIIVTAGPTVEPIDPVRILTNRSSGKMGYAIAEAARDRGADVVLISGPTALPQPAGMTFIGVETAAAMHKAVLDHFAAAAITIGVAAVSDWRAARPAANKLNKDAGPPDLQLEATPDILADLGARKRPDQVLIGFSLETDPERLPSEAKLVRKNLDLLVANNPTAGGSEFGGDTNDAILIFRGGRTRAPGRMAKRALADIILDCAVEIRYGETAPAPR